MSSGEKGRSRNVSYDDDDDYYYYYYYYYHRLEHKEVTTATREEGKGHNVRSFHAERGRVYSGNEEGIIVTITVAVCTFFDFLLYYY